MIQQRHGEVGNSFKLLNFKSQFYSLGFSSPKKDLSFKTLEVLKIQINSGRVDFRPPKYIGNKVDHFIVAITTEWRRRRNYHRELTWRHLREDHRGRPRQINYCAAFDWVHCGRSWKYGRSSSSAPQRR